MSSPLELNLMTFNPLPSTLALNAGLVVPELQTVDARRLTVARERYAQARRLLLPARNQANE